MGSNLDFVGGLILREALEEEVLFARTIPDRKLRIVTLFRTWVRLWA